jgi:hypothetical protein
MLRGEVLKSAIAVTLFACHPGVMSAADTSVAKGETCGKVAAFSLDSSFPGGNVIVDSIQGDTFHVRVDIRDSARECPCAPRQWAFRVKNAGGRTLSFQFPPDPTFGALSLRGPAVSHDNGLHWKWSLPEDAANPPDRFRYSFAPGENEVSLAWQPLYTEQNLYQTVDELKRNGASIRKQTLCKSEHGRTVDVLRFGCDNAKTGILLFVRHHANETWAAYVVDGMLRGVCSDTAEGAFLRKNASFFVVPFVDKDGVEAGDPGKSRRPHDHNRDYDKDLYASVRAIKEQTPQWAKGKRIIGIDFHACTLEIRGKRMNDPQGWAHNMLFLMFSRPTLDNGLLFSSILQRVHEPGNAILPYRPEVDRKGQPVGVDGRGMCGTWMEKNLNSYFTLTAEVPFARPDGRPITPAEARALGVDFNRAIVEFLTHVPRQEANPVRRTQK